jgi:glutaredoxin
MNKDTKIYLILVVIVLVIISGIFIRNYWVNPPTDKVTMQCIASKSMLIASPSCSHCAEQKKILDDYVNDFKIVNVEDDPTLWSKYNLIGVPTWVIDNKTYPGTKSVAELKTLTNC